MTPIDRERFRRQIIRIMAAAKDEKFTVSNLVDLLTENLPGLTYQEVDVQEALSLFTGLALVNEIPSELFGPPRFQITMQGRHFNERNS